MLTNFTLQFINVAQNDVFSQLTAYVLNMAFNEEDRILIKKISA